MNILETICDIGKFTEESYEENVEKDSIDWKYFDNISEETMYFLKNNH